MDSRSWILGLMLSGFLSSALLAKDLRVQPGDRPLVQNELQWERMTDAPDMLSWLLSTRPNLSVAEEAALRTRLENEIAHYRKVRKRSKNEMAFLKHVFKRTHRKFLRFYTSYTDFYTVFKTGEYNCLSASALYAWQLNQLGYTPQILESEAHVLIRLEADGQTVLFEATNPAQGFITSPEAVASHLEDVAAYAKLPSTYFRFQTQELQGVNLKQLAGLQHFNQAAEAFNKGNYQQAAEAVAKGRLLYNSQRFQTFARLLE